MKKNVLFVIVVAGLAALFLCSGAMAEMKIGNLRISPEIGVEEMYRSNIYQTQWDTKSDYITSIQPGFAGQYIFGGTHSVNFGYSGRWQNYAKYSDNNYWNHTAYGNLSLRFPGGLDIGAEQRYINNWIEKSAFIDYMRHYIENITGGVAAYSFANRWKAQVQYTRDDYAMSSSQDRFNSFVSNLYGGSLFYRLTARTSALVEYQYITKNFDGYGASDSKVNQAFLGVKFDPSGKLRGEVKLGYGQKKFDSSIPGRSTKTDTWVAYANLVQDFSKRTSLGLSASRSFQDDGNYANNAPYYQTLAALTFQHYFTHKIGGTAMVGYNRSEYQEETVEPITGIFRKRTDNAYSAGVGVFYNIQKYLKARLDYNYIKRDSNFEGYSFNENRAMFKVVYSP